MITISCGIQKGGVGKSTTSSILAYYFSEVMGKRVLAVDMDGQANFTQILTGSDDVHEFEGTTVCDAIIKEDATEYILKINDNLHILAGDENVNTLSPHFYIERKGQFHYDLKNALDKVADNYDYCIIDCPPALGELSIISLAASNHVLILFETSKFCYSSLKSYLNTIDVVKERLNPRLNIAGILRSMIDKRRSDNKYFSKMVEEEFPNLVLKEIITRKAEIGRLPAFGLIDNPEIKKVIKEYRPLMKELSVRVI